MSERSPFLTVEETARLLRCSTRSIHELTRHRRIPHRRLLGGRRCLFLEAELWAWADGADLEVIERPAGARVVRPVAAPDQDLRPRRSAHVR
jgi:excisionase family DNA binding protein